MKRFFLSIVLACGLLPLSAAALTPGELLQQAQNAYEKSKYQEAIQSWQTLSQIGFVNGDLFNNIGSAYWRLGEVGESRLYFLKARRLKPRDPEIRENLRFVNEKIGKKSAADFDALGPLRNLPFYRLTLNGGEGLWLAAISSAVLFGALTVFRLRKRKAWLILSLAMVLPLGYGLFFFNQNFLKPEYAATVIVISPKTMLFSAPTTDSKAEAELTEGEQLRKIRDQGDFVLVRTPSGGEAWVESKNIGEV